MTDIVKALRLSADKITEAVGYTDICNIAYHAADEIEDLRNLLEDNKKLLAMHGTEVIPDWRKGEP